jgi:hypothetical protein
MPTHHITDGVAWTADAKGMVHAGCNGGWPRGARFSLRVKPGDGFEARTEAKIKAHPKWPGLLALARSASPAETAAGSAASASDQLADAPAVAAGSETGPEAAV